MRWIAQAKLGAIASVLIIITVGCTPHVAPVFDVRAGAPMWPPMVEQARIRYVGELTAAKDLKPARSPLARLGDWIAGPPEPQPLYGPRAALRTPDGDLLWIADPGGRCLHRLDLTQRNYQKIAHAGDAPLLGPIDLCEGPANTLLLCDSESGDVHAFDARSGAFKRTLRLPDEIGRPVAIAYAPDTNELFVVDIVNHDIKVLDAHDKLDRILGQRGTGNGEFNFPCDIALDGDALWVVDTGNHRIQQIRRDGTFVSTFGQAGDMPGDLAMPKSVALDRDGHLHVVDSRFENLQVFDRTGQLLLVVGEEGTGPGEFWLPAGIFIDAFDRIWICDSYNARVQVFDYVPDANVATQATSRGAPEEGS